MSAQDKKEQAINPQPEFEEPDGGGVAPEQDESRIGGQAVGAGASGGDAATERDAERTGDGTGAKAGEYS